MLGKNVAFLLTRLPDTVFTVEQPNFYNTLTSIRGSQHENYLTAIDTSLKYIEDKEGIRCVLLRCRRMVMIMCILTAIHKRSI